MSPSQIVILGVVASALTLVLRLLATYANIHLGRFLINVLLFFVALGLSIAWTRPEFPPFGEDIGAWVAAVFQLAGPVVTFAVLIYNALYDQVVVPVWARFAKK